MHANIEEESEYAYFLTHTGQQIIILFLYLKPKILFKRDRAYTPVHIIESVKLTTCAWERKRR